jgi:hypothetical protein
MYLGENRWAGHEDSLVVMSRISCKSRSWVAPKVGNCGDRDAGVDMMLRNI